MMVQLIQNDGYDFKSMFRIAPLDSVMVQKLDDTWSETRMF
jgi:hypothetical protein